MNDNNPVLKAVLEAAALESGPLGPVTAPEREAAVTAFLDTLGVMAAGTVTETFAALHRSYSADADPAVLRHRLLRERISQDDLPGWLLLAGTAAHALDFDDVLETMNGHPSAVLVPLSWGLGRSLGCSGREIVDAYVAGVRSCAAVAGQVDVRASYQRGWHATSVIGTLAAAVTAARLLSLDEDGLVRALGIASSLSGGMRQNFGTDTKPLHVGVAARSGYEAARWAAGGLAGSAVALDGDYGWAALIGARETGLTGTCGVAARPLADPGLDRKPYPCCYNTQRMATAGLRAHERIGDRPIDSIHATVELGATRPLIYQMPETGLQAKFSAHYVLAESILHGGLPLASFTDEYVSSAASRTLIPRIAVAEDATHQGKHYEYPDGFAEVRVTLQGGETVDVVEYVPWGHHLNPLDREDIRRKTVECCDYAGMSRDETATLVQDVEDLTGE